MPSAPKLVHATSRDAKGNLELRTTTKRLRLEPRPHEGYTLVEIYIPIPCKAPHISLPTCRSTPPQSSWKQRTSVQARKTHSASPILYLGRSRAARAGVTVNDYPSSRGLSWSQCSFGARLLTKISLTQLLSYKSGKRENSNSLTHIRGMCLRRSH